MRYFLVVLLLFLISCTDSNKSEIVDLLEQRDASISQKDLTTYTSLLSDTYLATAGVTAIQNMERTFSTFEQVSMTSRDREIRILDNNKAICEQTYILKVFADGKWRKIVQREQLKFELKNGVWKINGGL